MPSIPQVRGGDPIRASHINEIARLASQAGRSKVGGVRRPGGVAGAAALMAGGFLRWAEFAYLARITEVIAANPLTKGLASSITYKAKALGRGAHIEHEYGVQNILNRPNTAQMRWPGQVETPIWPAKVGDLCMMLRFPRVEEAPGQPGRNRAKYEHFLMPFTEELAIAGPCGESVGSAPKDGDCGCKH